MTIKTENIPISFHPRAFSAFGSDLVTNDCVAIAELVKNCYDAFAYNVVVTITSEYIEIKDDGIGMTRDVIKNAWAVVATPYKQKSPTIQKDNKIRRVSGNKGLGRFSAARLGRYLKITTKSETEDCIVADIDWEKFENAASMADCTISISISPNSTEFIHTGTSIKIFGLYESWDSKKIQELENSLSRLISPFEEISDFNISLNYESYASPVQIKPLNFIKHPTYSISGHVNELGDIVWNYCFAPKARVLTRKNGHVLWPESYKGFNTQHSLFDDAPEFYNAGPFTFEIRAWDLDSDSVADVSDTFKIGRREIRNNISQYKGLSIYRDSVLVLPKSDASKDWLGIDIRRVSSIGKRISTSQIIGMINISSEFNPEIKDTTDREKLVDTPEYGEFCRIIETIILTLENQRYADKQPKEKKSKGLSDLISPLSADALVNELEQAVSEGKSADLLLETVKDYAAENQKSLFELNERLTYYAQTASLGSISVVILHEILTGMTVIKRFLNRIKLKLKESDEKTQEYFEDSETWHARLVDVAKSFAPLYRKNLHDEKGCCNIQDAIEKSIRLVKSKKISKDVDITYDKPGNLTASVFPGELQTILVNLLDNSLYWINYSQKITKKIHISVEKASNEKVFVTVSDSGTGISTEDVTQIFQPGITSKPGGIGMGLVIVTELLNNYDCRIATIVPGEFGGATFRFELPIDKGGNQ